MVPEGGVVGPERDEGDESVPSPVGGEGLGQEVAGGGVMQAQGAFVPRGQVE